MNITMTVVLIVVFALMLIMPYFTQKKRNKEYMDMLSNIKVGDHVKTAGGIIGKVNKISDKGEVRTFVLETGSKDKKSYLEMDMTMIYCVLNKSTKPAEDQNQQAEEITEKENQEIEENTSEAAERLEKTENEAEKPAKTTKNSTKKTSTKTTAKKTTKK